MPEKHTIDEQAKREREPTQGILVPLDLPEFEIVSQCIQADGSIEVQVKARKESEACPNCEEVSKKIHDTRKRVKRDITRRRASGLSDCPQTKISLCDLSAAFHGNR